MASSPMEDIKKTFQSEAMEHLRKADELLRSYAKDPSLEEDLVKASRHFHAVKGTSPLVGAKAISDVARTVEICLNRVISETSLFTPRLQTTLRFAITLMQNQIKDFSAGHPIRDGESVIRTIRSHLPTTQSVEDLLMHIELMSQELRNSVGETVQAILGKELEEGKRLYVLHVPPHKGMQEELPMIRAALRDRGGILSVAGRAEGSIHLLLASTSDPEALKPLLAGYNVKLTELATRSAQTPEPKPETRSGKAPERKEGKFKILFADDSQIARDLYKILLQRNGYDVEVAHDGSEALQCLRESSFDAVITDDQMPAMDGVELLEVAKNDERLYHIPFIVISGHANEEARSHAMKNGAAAYLVKGSFEKGQLLVILHDLLQAHE